LIKALWIATIVYSVAQGLSYGSRIALMMDVTNPRVAGTQFTAYMAMGNLAQVFAASWQGVAAEKFGYPATLTVDGLTGLLCILLLPLMRKVDPQTIRGMCDALAEGRARLMARALAPCCLAFLPYAWLFDRKSPFADILETVLTLIFVAVALLLYASTLLQTQSRALQRMCKGVAIAVLALYGRHWLPGYAAVDALCSAVVVAAALTLLRVSARPWQGLSALPDDVPAPAPRAGYPA
jgi:PAT family beta-lactamase induction signal transducer AmpG